MKKYYVSWIQTVKQSMYDVVYGESKEQVLEKFDKDETEGVYKCVSEDVIDIEDVTAEEA